MPARTTEPWPLPPTLPRLPERPERLVIPPTHLLAPAAGASADLRERLLARRIVLLGGEIDDEAALRVVGELLLLADEDPRTDIRLCLTSPGGSVTAALAIHDAMRSVTPDVATRAVGLTASAAQVLLTAGAAGKRSAAAHARIVLRRPSARSDGRGPVPADVLAVYRWECAEITARHSGRSVDEVLADTEAERWFTAEEAVGAGLVDRVG
ncbi:MAG: ATP-dependent Clp protease, protease subunit [Pseudonocardiales bacterium]|jgi:ATP-dependent Clp protease protease subunit|nr:ATP-dependent Clp protease, protease subunit [Pseudonocardiales bacterium]